LNPGEMFAAGALLVSLIALYFQSMQARREHRREWEEKAKRDEEMLTRLTRIEERGGAEAEKAFTFRANTDTRLEHIARRLDHTDDWIRSAEGRLSRLEGR